MKKHLLNKVILLFATLLLTLIGLRSFAQEDSVVAEQKVTLKYFNVNNGLQYLLLESVMKAGKKIDPLPDKSFSLYMDSVAAENLVGNVTTDKLGLAKSFIPVSLKSAWDASAQHTFIAQEKGKEEVTELPVVKSRITIDTASEDGKRSITVLVEKFENEAWVPLNEAEMKVGVRRLGSILSAGDDPTYTTDSSGTVTVEVTKDSLPGDIKGNVFLAVSIDDNETIGNVRVEKQVAWGVPTTPAANFFDQRTLWSTRNHTPLWLLFIAYSIVLSVWGTLIYLVFQLIKIKRLGKNVNAQQLNG